MFSLAVFETCGGPGTLELMKNPNPGAVPVTSPTGAPPPTTAPPSSPTSGSWAASGCAQDGGARALTGYTFSSNSMTPALCQNACASRSFSIAGIEYSSECYCMPFSPSLVSLSDTGSFSGGNSFSNNLGATIADSSCSMSCSGDASQKCGGSWTLSIFKRGPSKRSRHWLNIRD